MYSETKASGVEWLGDVPKDWQTVASKYLYSIQLGKMLQNVAQSKSDVQVAYLKSVNVQWENVNIDDPDTKMWASKAELRQYDIQEGDLLVCEGGEVGRAGIVPKLPEKFIIQNALHRVRSKSNDLRYLMYLLEAATAVNWFDVLCNRATIAHFTSEKFGALRFARPSLPEQQQIAAFLDRKTAELDAVLRLKERQLELLAEKRQALISQAVTRGLDPTAPLKPSGIPWLGEVPVHWGMKKIAWLFRIIGSGTTPSSGDESFYDGEFPWVNTGELNDNVIEETKKSVTEKAMHNLSALRLFPVDTLLIALYGATIGALGILGIPATTNQACCALADPRGISIEFAFYWFIGNRRHIIAMAYGGGQPNISQELVKQLRLALPPLKEQEAIVAQLKQEAAYIDRITHTTRAQIETVREYRQALISAAVTGKIDVRGLA